MKKLIYFTLSNNSNYIKLAQLCVNSLYKNGYNGDILFITNLEEEIKKNINFENKVFFIKNEKTDLMWSSANKLKIYNFSSINYYDKIIFSDLDVLFLSNADKIFEMINEDFFYVSNEQFLMSDEWWGNRLLTNDEKYDIKKNNILGINAGFFGFNKNMIKYMKMIDQFFIENIHLSNQCLEQPFFNVFLYRNKLYSNSLTTLISHNGYNLNYYDGEVLHFAGGPGNFEMKYHKMVNFLEKKNNDYIRK